MRRIAQPGHGRHRLVPYPVDKDTHPLLHLADPRPVSVIDKNHQQTHQTQYHN